MLQNCPPWTLLNESRGLIWNFMQGDGFLAWKVSKGRKECGIQEASCLLPSGYQVTIAVVELQREVAKLTTSTRLMSNSITYLLAICCNATRIDSEFVSATRAVLVCKVFLACGGGPSGILNRLLVVPELLSTRLYFVFFALAVD